MGVAGQTFNFGAYGANMTPGAVERAPSDMEK